MSNTPDTALRWAYVDGGGEHGWFTDAERAEMDSVRTPDATYTWRQLDPDEVRSFARWIGNLAYEQS